ncbi:hypothetical protein, partial [Pseudomonas turukhanskensis]|uniref:hypothetical protein n=1 Tax=Pseudomonas turukhanskensis TaxID=1806536 RepID=UPI0022F2E23E
GRAAGWRTGSSGRYGCPENLSVRFFPNSAGSPSWPITESAEAASVKGLTALSEAASSKVLIVLVFMRVISLFGK